MSSPIFNQFQSMIIHHKLSLPKPIKINCVQIENCKSLLTNQTSSEYNKIVKLEHNELYKIFSLCKGVFL